ncbi:MAG TPA: Asp23/Gls24 family envelope stress response protein [Rubrobacteraceae bacterium]|nr:Asp23/Gls24 family envelope stress response protein [Rubrobacteraceae bacterium]
MTEQRPPEQQRQESPIQAERGGAQRQQRQDGPLQTERGATRIEDNVVAKIAGIAAQEVEGVRMGGGATQAIGGILSSVTGGRGGGGESRGVAVEVGEVETAIDLTMTVLYGRPIPQVADAVRQNVVNRVENLVGLNVTEVNISVNDVFFPEQEQEQGQLEQQPGQAQQRVR